MSDIAEVVEELRLRAGQISRESEPEEGHEMEAECADLIEDIALAVLAYGQHKISCPMTRPLYADEPVPVCKCGWDAMREQLKLV